LALNNDIENQFATAVRVAVEVSRTNGATECAGTEVVTAYRERTLSENEHARWQAHFAACLRCQRTLTEISRPPSPAAAPSPEPAAEPARAVEARPRHIWRIALIVAAAAAIAVVMLAGRSLRGGHVRRRAKTPASHMKPALKQPGVSSASPAHIRSSTSASNPSGSVAAAGSETARAVSAAAVVLRNRRTPRQAT